MQKKRRVKHVVRLTVLKRLLWGAVVVAGVGALGLALYPQDRNLLADAGVTKTAALSADFELTDHRGMIQTDEDFDGKWMLVFFGFTSCPDVCPMGLSTMAQVMDDLGLNADRVQPLFITVDPERDTPAVLADYVPQFGEDILGLVGSPEQIARTAGTFKIYYERVEEASAPDGYTMGHTSSMLLFDPEGEFSRIYEFDARLEDIVGDLKSRIGT